MRRRVSDGKPTLLTLVLVAALVAAWPSRPAGAGSVPSGWPQPGYSADGARWNPYETILAPSNVSGLVRGWQRRSFWAGTVANGIVYGVADYTQIEARSARTGALRWRTDVDPPFAFATPATDGSRVCTASGWFPGSVYCFDYASA